MKKRKSLAVAEECEEEDEASGSMSRRVSLDNSLEESDFHDSDDEDDLLENDDPLDDEDDPLTEEDVYSLAKEWIQDREQPRDVVRMVATLLFCYDRSISKRTVMGSARMVSKVVKKDEKTIRTWVNELKANAGQFAPYSRGKYGRISIMMDEDCRRKATRWVRENASVKGKANMTVRNFQEYLNSTLLPGLDAPPDFPRTVSEATARRFLHSMGFKRIETGKKGVYVDGHEREDVRKYRAEYVKRIRSLEASHLPVPLPDDANPREEQPGYSSQLHAAKKIVLIYHDETTFQTNDDEKWAWGEKGQIFLRKKGRGAGIMISDFIEEYDGYLRTTNNEARMKIEYGAEKDGYWTGDKFLAQVKNAVSIAEEKYPRETHTVVWIFDHSSNHAARAKDALIASRMNVGPGKKQPRMRDTIWQGRPFKMVLESGEPKGLKKTLEDRGVNCTGLLKPQMVDVLSSHEDFLNEKSQVEHFIESKGHLHFPA